MQGRLRRMVQLVCGVCSCDGLANVFICVFWGRFPSLAALPHSWQPPQPSSRHFPTTSATPESLVLERSAISLQPMDDSNGDSDRDGDGDACSTAIYDRLID